MNDSTRAQAGDPIPAVTFIVVVLVVGLVGSQAMAAIEGREKIRQDICTQKFGENVTWVNDSDDTLDCRLSNGTVVENVSINLTSNHGTTTLGGDQWPAKNASDGGWPAGRQSVVRRL